MIRIETPAAPTRSPSSSSSMIGCTPPAGALERVRPARAPHPRGRELVRLGPPGAAVRGRARGEIVARAAAVVDSRYNRHWRERLGHIVMSRPCPGRARRRGSSRRGCEWLEARGDRAARAGSACSSSRSSSILRRAPPPFVATTGVLYSLLKDAASRPEKGLVDYKILVRRAGARWESAVRGRAPQRLRAGALRECREPARGGVRRAVERHLQDALGLHTLLGGEVALARRVARAGRHAQTCRSSPTRRAPVGVLWSCPSEWHRRARAGPCARGGGEAQLLGIGVRAAARGGRQHGDGGPCVPGAGAPRGQVSELHDRPRRQLAVPAGLPRSSAPRCAPATWCTGELPAVVRARPRVGARR